MNTIKINKQKVKMIAHRGLSSIEKENTNSAFVAAGNRSYFGIEADVRTTKDGKFVIIHDETTDRITYGKYDYNIEKANYEDFSDIVLPDIDKTTVRTDIKIPLLEEYIKICKKYEKVCVLELKDRFEKSDLARMVEEIRKTDYIENMIFISFDLENCLNIKELLPQNKVQWIVAHIKVAEEMIDVLRENHLDINVYYKRLKKDIIEKFHSYGIMVNCWTCDDKDYAEKLVNMGVDYISTNVLE